MGSDVANDGIHVRSFEPHANLHAGFRAATLTVPPPKQ
jgi:hypothetical protein